MVCWLTSAMPVAQMGVAALVPPPPPVPSGKVNHCPPKNRGKLRATAATSGNCRKPRESALLTPLPVWKLGSGKKVLLPPPLPQELVHCVVSELFDQTISLARLPL